MKVPRDRNGEYEPQIIGKYSRNADGMEEKILGLYACGMSQRDISEQIKSLYDVDISPELVSKISEKIMPEVTAWQNRPLEAVYPFVFLDAIHYKVKENHQYQTKAAYVVLGITMDGTKDILGVWIGEHESSKFWLNVLNDLKSRGVLDVYLFCVDGLKGFVEAIGAVYPQSQVQRCIVHQIRSSTRFVSYPLQIHKLQQSHYQPMKPPVCLRDLLYLILQLSQLLPLVLTLRAQTLPIQCQLFPAFFRVQDIVLQLLGEVLPPVALYVLRYPVGKPHAFLICLCHIVLPTFCILDFRTASSVSVP